MKKSLLIFLALFACAEPATSQRATINGVELDFIVRGEGPPLYLLHGGMESRENFREQIPAFEKYFTIVALDSREQGRSGDANTQISYTQMSDDVIALAAHLGHERISIMGLSDGGITALTTAINKPAFVDKLILLGANYHYTAYPEATREFIAGYEWDGATDPEGYPGIFIEPYLVGHQDLSGFGEKLQEMSVMWTTSPTFEKSDLGAVTAKTLVINGDHEDMGLDHVLALYDGIPDAQLFVVPDGDHYALQEKPALLNDVILEFMQETQ